MIITELKPKVELGLRPMSARDLNYSLNVKIETKKLPMILLG